MTSPRKTTLALLLAANSVVIGTVSTAGAVPVSPAVSWQSAGDSYSSGEGVYGNVGDCAQSDAAYGPLAADALRGEGWEISNETFTACTGHLVEDYFNARTDSDGKASLWEWSVQQGGPERVDVITMSFGGNDIGFGDVLAQCLLTVPENWKVVVATGVVGGVVGSLGGCDESEDELNGRVDALVDPDRGCSGSRRTGDVDYRCALQIGEREGSIVDFYYDIVTNHLTDRGRLYVVSYPRLFADVGQWPGWVKTTCQGVGRGDTEKLGRVAVRLNDRLREAVERANQALGSERVVFVDRLSLYRDGQHELCGTNEDWLNGIAFDRGDGLGLRKETSFHPNADGHTATANQLTELVRATYRPVDLSSAPNRPESFPWADDWTATPQLGDDPAAGSGCGFQVDYGASLPDGWWYGYFDAWDEGTGTGSFQLVCALLGDPAVVAYQACLDENVGEEFFCDNYFHPDFGIYPTGSNHRPLDVSAAADVGFQTEPDAYCELMSNVEGYASMPRWIHTTGGEIDFVFHICPFG